MERRHMRFLSLLISLFVMVSLCATTVFAEEITISEDPKCYLHGDVNGDGTVNAMDARAVMQYSVQMITADDLNLDAADVNGDGKVNAMDARLIMQRTIGIIESFPVEESSEEEN